MRKIKTAPLIPNKFDVEEISSTEINIRVSPFEIGYGITVAHPLRRLLFSSSIGYAPVAIKIDGASHEFDNISGMLEDISELIINLKSIRFQLKNGVENAVINYSFKGPKEINGTDLENEQVEVVTPNNFLASINEDGNLNMTLIIYRGIGYVPSEEIREEIIEEGFIPLDAYFTPVRRADYKIENILVDDNPNFEEIVFNVVTDGQISPIDAFENTLNTLKSQFSIFAFNDTYKSRNSSFFNDNATVITHSNREILTKEDEKVLAVLETKIKDFGLPLRIINSLSKAGYLYIGEVAVLTDKQLEDIKNLGKKSIEELKITFEKENLGKKAMKKFPERIMNRFEENLKTKTKQ